MTHLQSLPSRQLHLRPGSPLNGVLEGREMVAGGATTGSSGVPSVLSRRAPAGAREACGGSTSPSSARFSRPSRALPSSTMGDRVDPVVAPPANLSRASGTNAGADQFTGINNMIPDQAGYAVNHFPDINKMVFTPSSSNPTPQPR